MSTTSSCRSYAGSVHDQVEKKIGVGFDDLGVQQVKNIERPVRVFRVAAISSEALPSGILSSSIAVLPFETQASSTGAGLWMLSRSAANLECATYSKAACARPDCPSDGRSVLHWRLSACGHNGDDET